MKPASLSELKQELNTRPQKEILELCLRLAKFKKENKELLTFLLFEAGDLQSYIQNVKIEIDEQFSCINKTNLYFAKKSIRKILRIINKYIKYATSKEAEVELLIYFCVQLKNSGIAIHKSTALKNLFNMQIKKINKIMAFLHEDLQYEYLKDLEKFN
ncbi:MAG: hypothetical protein ABJA71_01760 [Ginsengibacter sp.]